MVWSSEHLCSEHGKFPVSDMSSNSAISVRIGDVVSPSTYWALPLASDGDERHSAIYMLEKVGANEIRAMEIFDIRRNKSAAQAAGADPPPLKLHQ